MTTLGHAKKILILGPPCSGKSYLARELSKLRNIPHQSLDPLYWQKEWEPIPHEDFKNLCHDLASKDSWIIDGNFGTTFEERWSKADFVIYLQPNHWLCQWRQFLRALFNRKDDSRPQGMRERYGMRLFWFTKKFEGAHGKLITSYMKEKYPQLPVLKVKGAEDILKQIN